MVTQAAHRSDDGFTLVELLVSLTILALLLAMVPGTLRLGRRAWETPGQLDQASAELAALGFVETHVKSAVPIYERDAQGVSRIAFWGSPQSLGFVVPLSAGPYGGGLYRIDLGSALQSESGPVLRVSIYQTANATAESVPPAEVRPLGRRLTRLQFRYFGPLAFGEVPLWHDAWTRTDRLPDLIEIEALSTDKSLIASPVFRSELKLRPIS